MRTLFVCLMVTSLACGVPLSQTTTDAGTDAGADAGLDTVATDGGTRALAANDVSVLFPLSNSLWPASTEGVGGPFLPPAVFAQLPKKLVKETTANSEALAGLRVVALRVDPCFPGAPCRAQLRLVVQRVVGGTANDGALHLLYGLDAQAFATLVASLRTIATLAPENASATTLGVSPALQAQGLDGAYGRALLALVKRTIGAATLERLTFMTRTNARSGTWEFGAINVRGFTPTGAVAIQGLQGETLQTVTRGAGARYTYSLTPNRAQHAAVLSVLSGDQVAAADAATLATAREVLGRLENPTLEHAESVDCASCHLARHLRVGMAGIAPGSAPASTYAESAPAAVGAADGDFDNLRAFGWFDTSPVVNPRVANETREVLRALEMQ